jgi:hypothetical protein
MPWINYHGCLRFYYALVFSHWNFSIIAKLYLQREYDYKLEDLETALKATIEQDKYQRTLLVKLATMHDKVYGDIADDKNCMIYSEKRHWFTRITI